MIYHILNSYNSIISHDDYFVYNNRYYKPKQWLVLLILILTIIILKLLFQKKRLKVERFRWWELTYRYNSIRTGKILLYRNPNYGIDVQFGRRCICRYRSLIY